MRAVSIAVASVLISISAAADEKPVYLVMEPGLDKVETHCSACHSLDYIIMNSPFLNSAVWGAEVTKMISGFGAPISEADAKIIVEYLKQNYGTQN
jgi:hypothetical protein